MLMQFSLTATTKNFLKYFLNIFLKNFRIKKFISSIPDWRGERGEILPALILFPFYIVFFITSVKNAAEA